MAWVRLDDGLPSHPKILSAWSTYPASIGLWALALAWSARTDGHITPELVHQLIPGRGPRERAIAALEEPILWVPNDAGWEIHDWRKYNYTRAQVEERKRADRERKRTGVR